MAGSGERPAGVRARLAELELEAVEVAALLIRDALGDVKLSEAEREAGDQRVRELHLAIDEAEAELEGEE